MEAEKYGFGRTHGYISLKSYLSRVLLNLERIMWHVHHFVILSQSLPRCFAPKHTKAASQKLDEGISIPE